MQDVTARIRADEELRRSKNDLTSAQRLAHVGSWRWNTGTDEVVWSDEHWAILGLEPGEAGGIDPAFFDTFVHPDDLKAVRSARWHSLNTGSPFDEAFRIVRRDGETRYLQSRSDRTNRHHNMVGTVQDVTDQFEAEAAVRKSQAMFERAFDSNPGLASIVSFEDRRLLKVNEVWCKRLGYKREEVIGKTLDDLGIWFDKETRRAALAELAETGVIRAFPTKIVSARGDTILLDVFSEVLEFEGGRAVFTVSHDRTERKTFEDALWEAKEIAELTNRTKSEFLANLSHELRTPLNAISGFSQAMQAGIGGPPTEKQREYLNDIQSSGDHLLALINDVLDLSKVELGELELSDEPVDLADCIKDSVHMFNGRKQTGRLEVATSGVVDLPPIRGDGRKIRQILINLLSNAFKFTDRKDKIVVDAGAMTTGAVYFQVSDTGIGMSPEELKVALTMFGQVDTGMDRSYEGSGLGLPLCKSLVEAHGGTLEIESSPGIGTKVRVIFPPERVVTGDAATAGIDAQA